MSDEIPYAMRSHPDYEGAKASEDQQLEPPSDLTPAIGSWLQTNWPVRVPTIGMSMAEIQREAGRQDMIHFILQAIAYLDEQDTCADQPPP